MSAFSKFSALRTHARSYVGLSTALSAMIVLFGTISKHFLTANTFSTITNEIPDLLVMSVGMTFVLIIGGNDLSVGSVLAVAGSAVSGAVVSLGWGPLPAAVGGLVVAGLCGAITGVVSVTWKIPSFIVSLGVLEIARGLAYRLTDSRTEYVGGIFEWLSNPCALGISPAFIVAFVLMITAQVVLVKTVFGRYLVGIGTNEEAVRLAGINPPPFKVAVYILASALAGVAAPFL